MNDLLSVKQVAFILKVHPLTIRRYIKEKKLKAIKVGGNIRISEQELQTLHQEATPTPKISTHFKIKQVPVKNFSSADPFLRLEGRGASFALQTQQVKILK